MLKITTYADAARKTLKLEGRLAGPWVEELKSCWQQGGDNSQIEIILNEVTFIDEPGRKLLAEMHRQGVELTAAGCMTKAIIEEIMLGEK